MAILRVHLAGTGLRDWIFDSDLDACPPRLEIVTPEHMNIRLKYVPKPPF